MFINQKQKKHVHRGFEQMLLSTDNFSDIVAEVFKKWALLMRKKHMKLVFQDWYIVWSGNLIMSYLSWKETHALFSIIRWWLIGHILSKMGNGFHGFTA